MNNNLKCGKDIDYSELIIIRPEDREKLQAFYCGNTIQTYRYRWQKDIDTDNS